MGDHEKEKNDLIAKIKKDYQEQIDTEIKTLRVNLEKNIQRKVIAYAAVVVTIAVLSFITVLLYSTKDVNKAVIDLQKDIISAQKVIRDSVKELDEMRSLLSETKTQLDTARTHLVETQKIYEKRIESLTKREASVYELKWSDVNDKNHPPISDIAIDTRRAQSVSILAEPLNKDTHKSTNMQLIVLASPIKEGNYQEYFTENMTNNKFQTVGATPYAGFLKLRLSVNDGHRADIKVLVSVVE